eukprot:GILI01050091.1.p2 GENE.GILI01050091.1~~GILI01050091.1.p2  ORF type:complete len:101 (+),score=1.09 GILI01050091.1:224-526(+)
MFFVIKWFGSPTNKLYIIITCFFTFFIVCFYFFLHVSEEVIIINFICIVIFYKAHFVPLNNERIARRISYFSIFRQNHSKYFLWWISPNICYYKTSLFGI